MFKNLLVFVQEKLENVSRRRENLWNHGIIEDLRPLVKFHCLSSTYYGCRSCSRDLKAVALLSLVIIPQPGPPVYLVFILLINFILTRNSEGCTYTFYTTYFCVLLGDRILNQSQDRLASILFWVWQKIKRLYPAFYFNSHRSMGLEKVHIEFPWIIDIFYLAF